MSGYRIGKVQYVNYGPFEDVEFDFSVPGLTVVEGRIDGKRGCDSNGAGKSFLFDGVAWALYGRCIREKYAGDDVIRLNSRGGAAVTVELIDGEDTVRIERYRKHRTYKNQVRLFVGGVERSRGTSVQTTKAIEVLIGMDYTAFSNSVAFGVREDVKSFFSAPDTERKKVLETILGLELYAEAEKIARSRLRKISDILDEVEARRQTLTTRIEETVRLLRDFEQADPVEDRELEIKKLRLKVKYLKIKEGKVEAQKVAVEGEILESEEAFEEVMRDYHRSQDEAVKKLARAEKTLRGHEREKYAEESKKKSHEHEAARMQALEDTECPTCRQPVPKKQVGKVVKTLMGEVARLAAGIAVQQEAIDACEREIECITEPEEPSNPQLRGLHMEYAAIEREESEARRESSAAEARLSEAEKAHGREARQKERLKATLTEARRDLRETDEEYADTKARHDFIEFWVEGFGNRGLKSFLIEAEIPAINKRATEYALRLLGDGAMVRLSATKELKSRQAIREELTVEGRIPGCTEKYAGASKGQKKRMDLSLLLAFRDLVASRSAKSFEQLFADEIFDGMDPSGSESIVELLREVSQKCPVVLVTHDPRIKPVADRVIRVRHRNGKAVLEGLGTAITQCKSKPRVTRRKRLTRVRRT